MFDDAPVKAFQELSRSDARFNQADNEVNYYNVFLCVSCFQALNPDCMPASVAKSNQALVKKVEENFNRIVINCFNAFKRDLYILELNCAQVDGGILPYFVWKSELSKELLSKSGLLTAVKNLEVVSKFLVLLGFSCLQYIADFIKLCALTEDVESAKSDLG